MQHSDTRPSTPRLSTPGVLAGALALAASGCYAPTHGHVHWNSEQQLPRSVILHTTGHDTSGSDTFGEHLRGNYHSLVLTLRRHFLNSNPGNPYQASSRSDHDDPPGEPTPPEDFEVDLQD